MNRVVFGLRVFVQNADSKIICGTGLLTRGSSLGLGDLSVFFWNSIQNVPSSVDDEKSKPLPDS